MHIVSASRRTDIPAFHNKWLLERLKAGYADVRAPFGAGLKRVSLRAEDVICIVFWTKDARPLIPYLEELYNSGICCSFLYTVNNYPVIMEPRTPSKSQSIEAMASIRKKFPKAGLRWRYDTIVLTDKLDDQWHINNFRGLCKDFQGLVDECLFSFCDYYKKTMRNMKSRVPGFREPELEEKRRLTVELGYIAQERRIRLLSCGDDQLVDGSISKARCIDVNHLWNVVDSHERLTALRDLKVKSSRKGCGCYESVDIGAYNTCGHGCVYCYANADPDKALENLRYSCAGRESLNNGR